MRRLGAMCLALVMLAMPAMAQVGPQNITANGQSATFAIGTQPNITIDVSGTWTGTLTFEGTVNGTDYRTITVVNTADLSTATTTTASGSFSIVNTGFVSVRAKASATITGTAVVYGRNGYGSVRVPAGTFGGTIVSASTAFRAGNGSAGTPSYSFTSNTNRGLFNDTVNSGIGMAIAGAQVGYWNASGLTLASGKAISAPTVTATSAVNAPTGCSPTFSFTGVATDGLSSCGLNIATTTAQTASAPVVNTTQTWNNAGVTFTGWKLNVTDTNSASASLLADLQVGASSKFKVDKAGVGTFASSLKIGASSFFEFLGNGVIRSASNGVFTFNNNAEDGATVRLCGGGTTSSFPSWKRSGANWQARTCDDSANTGVTADAFSPLGSRITDPSTTGVAFTQAGLTARAVAKITVSTSAFVCAATTCDVSIATIPAKTFIGGVYAELVTTFACTATCTTSTLSMTLGTAAAGTQLLASFDADAAAGWFGDGDAELGADLARATAVQGGGFYISGKTLSLRLTSGSGNIGTGSATNLSQGSIVFYLFTERLP